MPLSITDPARRRGLDTLEATLRRDLDILCYPGRDWMTTRATRDGQHAYDTLIIGAGQGGLSLGFGLIRERVGNILLLDENPCGREGPWLNFARMVTLRTPKYVTGPDHGVANLSPRAWWEAQFGDGAWETLGLIPKEEWAAYLYWYRTFLEIPVQNDSKAGAIRWDADEGLFEVPVTLSGEHAGKTESKWARTVVFANGIDGSGKWQVPDFVSESLPAHRYSHTRHPIDFEALRGKRVGVLGAGASAFDNASVALETGAAAVHLFFRRPKLPNVNTYRWAEFVGFLKHHGDLSDADRWRFIHRIVAVGQLPPTDTYFRAKKHPNFHLHPASPWNSVEELGDHARVITPHGTHDLDFLIIGTGFRTNLHQRPEWANLCDHVALWQDRYTPPAELSQADLGRHPYLGPNFELTEREPGSAPWLHKVFNYTFGCLVSLGFGGASISGMKYGQQRLIDGITRRLYIEDAAQHFESLEAFDLEEFTP